MAPAAIDVDRIVAFDVHVHLEHTGEQTDADKHAAAYFKGGGARDAASLAEYYPVSYTHLTLPTTERV